MPQAKRKEPNEIAKAPKAPPPADDRIHEVFGWILSGASQHDIEQAIVKTWPDEQTKPLIVAAMSRISKAADADPDAVRGWAMEATRSIYQKSLEVGDHQTALRALKQIVELSRQ